MIDVQKTEWVRRPRSLRQITIFSHLRHKELPIKFQYDGIGATRYDNLCRDPGYISSSELGLLGDKFNLLLQTIKNKTRFSQFPDVNIIDIGCGNGESGAIILSSLINHLPSIRFRYVALDISWRMRNIAKKTIDTRFNSNKEYKTVDIFTNSIDFERDRILNHVWAYRQIKTSINIYLFLGNTLGNYREIDDQRKILLNISQAMRKTDFLILGVELASKYLPHSLVEMYSNPLVIDFLSSALKPFGIIPDRGEQKGQGKIVPRIVHHKDIEINFKFSESYIVRGSVASEDTLFSVGDKIRLANSTRFFLPLINGILLPKAHLKLCMKEITGITGSAVLLCCLK